MSLDLSNVTMIVVTYNSARWVNHVTKLLQKANQYQVQSIVVDNASTDSSADIFEQSLSGTQAVVLRNTQNLGFGAANNLAMHRVNTKYALLLNPDCAIEPRDISQLLQTLERYPQAGMVSPQVNLPSGEPQLTYRYAFFRQKPQPAYRGYIVPDAVCSAEWLSGCCILVNVTFYREIQGFDESFFLYYEDDDLCLRMRQAGHECLLDPQAVAVHTQGQSSPPSLKIEWRKNFHHAYSRRKIIAKHVGSISAWWQRIKIFLSAPFALIFYSCLLQKRHAVKWAAWGASVFKQ